MSPWKAGVRDGGFLGVLYFEVRRCKFESVALKAKPGGRDAQDIVAQSLKAADHGSRWKTLRHPLDLAISSPILMLFVYPCL